MKKLTLKKAFELSVEKWEYIVGEDGENNNIHADLLHLNNLLSMCGLCEYYGWKCKQCALSINPTGIHGCSFRNHPWQKWNQSKTKETAQSVLNLIKKRQAAHLKRYYKTK